MSLLSLEHSRRSYQLDFVLYGLLCLAIAAALLGVGPAGHGTELLAWVLGGVVLWSLLEYLLHRFVLHGLAPFSHWHAQHHAQPQALIASPIAVSLSSFLLLATLPAWWLLGMWPALALTLGLFGSYIVYGLTHHATHHHVPAWLGRSAWMQRRRRRHAMHHAAAHIPAHGAAYPPCHFGVSSSLWDTVFGTKPSVRTMRHLL